MFCVSFPVLHVNPKRFSRHVISDHTARGCFEYERSEACWGILLRIINIAKCQVQGLNTMEWWKKWQSLLTGAGHKKHWIKISDDVCINRRQSTRMHEGLTRKQVVVSHTLQCMVTSSEKSLRSECHYSQNCCFRVKTRLELYNSNKWRHVKLYFESCIASLRRFPHVLSRLGPYSSSAGSLASPIILSGLVYNTFDHADFVVVMKRN